MSMAIVRNKSKILFNGYNQFLTNKEISQLNIYIMMFLFFSLSIIPKDIILSLIVVIFAISTLKSSLLMFLFFSLWENVTVFSFGITLNLILQVVFCIKILANSFNGAKTLKYRYLDIIILISVLFYGVMNFLVGTRNLSGIGIGINVLIVIYATKLYNDKYQYSEFWKALFFVLLVSTLLSIIYGIINDTGLSRWISGMGYMPQLYGTLGTARIGMFIVASLIYPVFYIKKKVIRVGLSILLTILAFMTLSITTIICLLNFWAIVLIFKRKATFENVLKLFLVMILVLLILFIFGSQIKEVSFIKPIVIRVSSMIESFQMGDMKSATSSRSNLLDAYMDDFRELPIFNKIFGTFYINRFSIIIGYNNEIQNYAHNSFVDILLYTGFFGVISIMLLLFKNLKFHKKRYEFLPILLLKATFILTGLSVSMLSSTYWFIWLFI